MALFVNAAESLGHTTSVEHGVIRPGALNILFATHSEPLASLKKKAEHIDFVPMGYMPVMSCIPTNVPQDIDVLFLRNN
ncbi:hypothetical protein GCM10009007_08030 [Formosimonas limnophila]|uniref:Uncharacterized protein n=1 Tax=Formosimonas limnophila TaxID=1384487 RepID=A0A8J3CMB1_9BURK|nr:hypothetical protein [Formosimonas limnophila]GHA69815.1 hypothetical protein GCM10009007_08030 [Formosimonas limnophila]